MSTRPGTRVSSAPPGGRCTARGLGGRWCPVFGDHDALVAGELVPTAVTQALAVGNRALWDLPQGLSVPPGEKLTSSGSPDGPPQPVLVDQLLTEALRGPTVTVPPDPARRELPITETVSALALRGRRLPPAPPRTASVTRRRSSATT